MTWRNVNPTASTALQSQPGGPEPVGRLLTALLTPCAAGTGEVNFSALGSLVEHQVSNGVDGLFILGTAGQGPLLTLQERKDVAREVIGSAGKRLAVVCHVGAATTADTLELLDAAVASGAAAIASVPPTYYSPDSLTVREYYLALLERSPVPVYAYDNPKATGYGFSVAELLDLVEQGLAGVKVARSDYLYLNALITAGVPTWTANANLNAVGFYAGARGAISTITNLAPALFRTLHEAAARNDVSTANALQTRVDTFAAAVRTPIIGGLHHGAQRLGLPAGAPRRPLRLPHHDEQRAIDQALKDEGLL